VVQYERVSGGGARAVRQRRPQYHRGLGYGNFDAAIAKSFPLQESARLKFQAEFYNFTNSSNWVVEPPGSSSSPHSLLLNNPLPQENINTIFGTMQGDRGARVLQFSLRLDFWMGAAPGAGSGGLRRPLTHV